MRAAAFFDLEGTLTPDKVDLEIGKEGYRQGVQSSWVMLVGAWDYLKYAIGLGGTADMKRSTVRRGFTGKHEKDALKLCQDYFDSTLRANIYGEALETIEEHRREGVDLYIISASFHTSVIPYHEHLGFKEYFATVAQTNANGVFTGATVEPVHAAERKAVTLQQVAEREGYDLEACYAYGDSRDDRFMLEKVGHPFAINPKRDFLRHAEERGWGILTWHQHSGE